jgi:hypothetical protein
MTDRNKVELVSENAATGGVCNPEPDSRNLKIPRRSFLSWSLFRTVTEWLQSHQDLLWWFHSGYALLLGIGVMWLGAKHFSFLRVVIFYIAFIWLSALCLPLVARHPAISPAWQGRIRIVICYFSKNFYQQLLFFLLPIYYSSSTFPSANFFFVLALAASAVFSTMDVFYDRYIAVKWRLTTLFLTFNLFACINVMLPLLWGISNSLTLWISAGLALLCIASLIYRLGDLHRYNFTYAIAAAAILLVLIVIFLRPLIPPVPLQLGEAGFGKSVRSLELVAPFDEIPSNWSGRISALTAIKAPNGLKEKVCHRWFVDGKLVYSLDPREIVGGREKGFRLWSQITWGKSNAGREIILNVETEGGQLIGRAHLRAAP